MNTRINKKLAQQIVNTVKDVCGHDINFIDEYGTIFASTNEERIGQYHEVGKQVAVTNEMMEVSEDDSFKGTKKGVNIPIFHNGILVAVIGISGDPEEVRKYGYLAVKITMLLIREQELEAFNRSQKEKMNYVMHSLLGDEGVNREYLLSCLEEMKIEVEEEMCVFYIKINTRYNISNITLLEQQLIRIFKQTGCSLYTYHYPNQYVGIIGESKLLNACKTLEEFAADNHELLKIAVGTKQSLYQLKKSYEATQITIASLEHTGKAFAIFDHLDLGMVIGSLEKEIRGKYLNKTVKNLSKEDMELLKIYYEEEMSLTATGKRLFLHKNTLQYKLDKIARETGYNPRKFKDAVVLYLALQMI